MKAKCILIFWPETGQGAAIMSNGNGGGTLNMEIIRSVSEEYAWDNFQIREKELVDIPAEDLLAFAGTYKPKPGAKFEIIVEEGRIFIDNFYVPPEGRKQLEIFPESEDTFFATEINITIQFTKDDSGKITSFRLNQNGRRREGEKVQ